VKEVRPAKILEPDLGEVANANSALRFTPYAWEKMQFMLGAVGTEIGGFGLANADDYLLIEDIIIPKQTASMASVSFDKQHLAALAMELADPDGEFKFNLNQCLRIWLHTHPGMGTSPSPQDIKTFTEPDHLGSTSWGIMVILSDVEEPHCQYRVKDPSGNNCFFDLPVDMTVGVDFPAVDDDTREGWKQEIIENVEQEIYFAPTTTAGIPGHRRNKAVTRRYEDFFTGREDYYGFEDYYNNSYGNFPSVQESPSLPPTGRYGPVIIDTEYEVHRDSFLWGLPEENALELFSWGDEPLVWREVASKDGGLDGPSGELIRELQNINVSIHKIDQETGIIQFKVDLVTSVSYLTSDQVLQLDKPAINSSTVGLELCAAEERLTSMAAERDPDAAGVQIDGFDAEIDILYHWVCQDNSIIYVTAYERSELVEVASGAKLANEALFAQDDFDLEGGEIGFFLGDDTPDDLSESRMEDAIVLVGLAIDKCRQEGLTVGQMDMILDNQLVKSAEKDGYEAEFRLAVSELRRVGYDRQNMDNAKLLAMARESELDIDTCSDDPQAVTEALEKGKAQ